MTPVPDRINFEKLVLTGVDNVVKVYVMSNVVNDKKKVEDLQITLESTIFLEEVV